MTRLQARTLLVVILLAVCGGLIALNQTGQLETLKGWLLAPLAAIQQSLASATGRVIRLWQDNPDLETLRQRNAELELQVAQLQTRVVDLQENEADLRILTSLLNYARSVPDNEYKAANVIGRDSSPFLGYLIIDVGTDDNVRRGLPVVTNQGLVGQVVEVSCCAAKVRLIVDPASAVNARLQASRDEGVVTGLLGGGLEMQYLSQQAVVNPGDIVISSGLGGAYPEGLVLGTVSSVQKQNYEVLQKASLTPSVDFSRLEIVLVIVNFQAVDLTLFEQPSPTPAINTP
jgi:rod shape-determining protein MreC